MEERGSSMLHERLADSKKLLAHQHIALGEAWSRAIAESMTGHAPPTRDALLELLSLREREHLRAACVGTAGQQCWSRFGPFVSTDDQVGRARGDLRRLRDQGVDVIWARCEIVCTRRLNDARRVGRSRMLVDLAAMEELVLAARRHAGEDITAICGKVGGLTSYPRRFGPLGGAMYTTLREDAAQSAYRIAGVGEVRFVRDADDADPLVALASLVGKTVREDLMSRVVEHYRGQEPALPDASGYHDPVTDRFIAGTERIRALQAVPDTCFVRDREPKAPR